MMMCSGILDKNLKQLESGDKVIFKGVEFEINFECSAYVLARTSFETDMYEIFEDCWNDDFYPLIQLYWHHGKDRVINELEIK